MTAAPATLVVISHYDRRGTTHLERLLASLHLHDGGEPFDIVVVANRTTESPLDLPYRDRFRLLERHNIGMNIAAWDYAWRENSGHDCYLFLQDECVAVRDNWLTGLKTHLTHSRVGLVGEALNSAWDLPWAKLAQLHRDDQMPDHWIDGAPAKRVDAYLDFMQRKNIDPGLSGAHLRALAWMTPRNVLEAIGGFPTGLNYGECIAAEIAVSRMVVQRGFEIRQARPEPFHFFRHFEWNKDFPERPFTHTALGATRKQAIGLRDAPSRRSWPHRVLGWLKQLTR
jgi:hypothetical protein